MSDENSIKILDAFKKHGWKLTNLDVENLDKMAMSRYRLEGNTSKLTIKHNETIRFIKRPVPAETKFIDAEIFQYSVMTREIEIVI